VYYFGWFLTDFIIVLLHLAIPFVLFSPLLYYLFTYDAAKYNYWRIDQRFEPS